jgi:FkbM family methyltransferase
MRADSIEEKLIWDKLTAGMAVESMPEPSNPYQATLNIDDWVKASLSAMVQNDLLIQTAARGYIDPTVGLGPPLVRYPDESIWARFKRALSGVFIRPGRKIFAALIVATKKTVLKLTRWYVQSIVAHQLEFNKCTLSAVDRLAQIVEEQKIVIEALHATGFDSCINDLNTKISTINGRYSQLSEQQDKLGRQQKELSANQNSFGGIQESLSVRQDELGGRQESLSVRQDELSGRQESLSVRQDELSGRQESLSVQQDELGGRQDELEQLQRIGSEQIQVLQELANKLRELDINGLGISDTDEHKSFAQTGEDMIVDWLLCNLSIPMNEVVYLDLGANHAKKLSNTYHFYLKGAKGVLVEANPALIPELKFYRHNDVILNFCVAEHSDELMEFTAFELGVALGDGLSTTDRDRAEQCLALNSALKLRETISVKSITVDDLIEKYLGRPPVILNIDLEGDELKILQSINFEKYRPAIIIVEMISYGVRPINAPKDLEIMSFMEGRGYVECAFTGINSIFIDGERVKETAR